MNSSFSSSLATKYILVDFSCSREYTHHAEYMCAFADYLQTIGQDYELWINRAADSGVRSLLKNHPVHSILNSFDYSFMRNQSFLNFVLTKITGSFLDISKISLRSFGLHEKILKFTASLFTKSAMRRLKLLQGECTRIVIVLPTVDGLALRFLSRIALSKFSPISISMRLTGGETRGVFETTDLNSLIKQIAAGVSDLRIGWETHSMRDKLIESGIQPEKLYWSPIPTTSKPSHRLIEPKRMTLGFLGSARRNKGFSSIPHISELLSDLDIDFLVQEANFEWDDYSTSMDELHRLGDRIEFVPGAASNGDLKQSMSGCSVLVLPYEVDSYRFAGSGIMYQAANLGIPIFCTEGVGFDWDVKSFGIGSTFCALEELRSLVTNFDSTVYFQNIVKYNHARNLACSEFLG